MIVETQTKKWGNSVGVIIPNSALKKLNIKPEERIIIDIHKKTNVLKELFGAAKSKNKSAKQMINEFRKEAESKW